MLQICLQPRPWEHSNPMAIPNPPVPNAILHFRSAGDSLAVQQQLAPGPPPQPSVFGKLPPIKHKSAAAPKLPAAISKTCSNPGCKMPHLGQRCRHACKYACWHCWQHARSAHIAPLCTASGCKDACHPPRTGKWLQRCLPPASQAGGPWNGKAAQKVNQSLQIRKASCNC